MTVIDLPANAIVIWVAASVAREPDHLPTHRPTSPPVTRPKQTRQEERPMIKTTHTPPIPAKKGKVKIGNALPPIPADVKDGMNRWTPDHRIEFAAEYNRMARSPGIIPLLHPRMPPPAPPPSTMVSLC